jgi:hypothetical protein
MTLRRIVGEFRRGMLGKGSSALMCFAVCAPLQSLLEMAGYPTELIEGEVENTEHYWLQLPDGRIVDPTADQLTAPDGSAMPKVFIGEKPEWYLVSQRDR